MAKLCRSSLGAVRKTTECGLDLTGAFMHLGYLNSFVQPARNSVTGRNGTAQHNTHLRHRQARLAQHSSSTLEVFRETPKVAHTDSAKQAGPLLPNQSGYMWAKLDGHGA